MIINAFTAKQLSDDANRYDACSIIAHAIKDATGHGRYSCNVILKEQCTKDAKKKYRGILEELRYNVEVKRHLEEGDRGYSGYYNISIDISWGN